MPDNYIKLIQSASQYSKDYQSKDSKGVLYVAKHA